MCIPPGAPLPLFLSFLLSLTIYGICHSCLSAMYMDGVIVMTQPLPSGQGAYAISSATIDRRVHETRAKAVWQLPFECLWQKKTINKH